jgi:YidC/Oxa1 family membrane protein insertase
MEEKQSQLSTYIGMGLIFLLLFLWMQYSAPPKKTPEELQAEQTAQAAQQPAQNTTAPQVPTTTAPNPIQTPDTAAQSGMMAAKFGVFAAAAAGEEQFVELENDLVRITFTSKGGRIKEVFLKKFEKVLTDTAGKDFKSPLRLLEDNQNRFEYEIPVGNTASGKVLTSDLYFTPNKNGNTITFRADAGAGRYLEQTYTLTPDNYRIDYRIAGNGLENVLTQKELRFTGRTTSTNWSATKRTSAPCRRSISNLPIKRTTATAGKTIPKAWAINLWIGFHIPTSFSIPVS